MGRCPTDVHPLRLVLLASTETEGAGKAGAAHLAAEDDDLACAAKGTRLMLQFLFAFIANPMVLLSIAAGVAVLAALFFAAPRTFAKVALHPVTWIVILGIALATGYAHLSSQNEALRTEVQQSHEIQRSKDDATATIREHHKRQQRRQTERERITDAISHAKPGQAYDDALDEIARIQAAPAPVDRQPDNSRMRDNDADGAVRP